MRQRLTRFIGEATGALEQKALTSVLRDGNVMLNTSNSILNFTDGNIREI
jgi:hypothetical protein